MEAVPGPRQLTGADGGFAVEELTGRAGELHATDVPASRLVRRCDVDHPALALGSAQRADHVDRRVADALGLDVVKRRSGGGAVLMLPGEMVWVDVVIPAGDTRWRDDVGAAMWWVGEVWAEALASFGVAGTVHTGPLVRTPWSRQVCFSGVGPGEVIDPSGAKLVGIAARRTRRLARFQTMCHLVWRPELVSALVAGPRPAPAELAPAVATVPAAPDDLFVALVAALATR